MPPKPLFVVQTIGKPKAAGPEWGGVVSALAKLGANPILVNALDGTTEYALIGHLDYTQPAVESSTAYDHGPLGDPHYPAARLVGSLARARNYRLEPTVSSTPTSARPDGLVNLDLIELAYQQPRAFPSLVASSERPATEAEGAAAESFICRKLDLCKPVNGCPSVRACYWQKLGGTTWTSVRSDLGELAYPGKGSGFEDFTFKAVKGQLTIEISALQKVKDYFAKLQDPLDKSVGQSFVDVSAISQKVVDSLKRPAVSNTTSWALGLVGKAVAVGGFLGPPFSGAAAGLSAVFGLAAYVSNETGRPILGSEVKAEAARLGAEMVHRIDQTRQVNYGLARLVASDYGKLMDLSVHATGDWEPSDNPENVAVPLRTGTRQWFYEALVPTAYPYLIRANNNARNVHCVMNGGDRVGWPNQPDSAQAWVTVGYDDIGNPIRNMFFFARGLGGANSPPDSLAGEMFKSRNEGGLGIEKLSFFTPRVFNGKVAHAVNTGGKCELGGMPVED